MLNPQRHCYRCRARVRAAEPYCSRCTAPLIVEGRYRINEILGKGGWGTVYSAEDLRLRRSCAIKAVPADEPYQRDSLEDEWQRLRDYSAELPFIPAVFDVVHDSAAVYLVMELIMGSTLAQQVALDGPWDGVEVEAFLRALLANLGRLHQHGLIHRDLKPQNIMLNEAALGPERRYMLIDFGIARHEDEPTQYYGRAVSLSYSPPEQRAGQTTDCRSDLFSLAATAYYLLTGDAPPDIVDFLRASPHEVLGDLLRAKVPPALGHTLLRMLDLSRDQRPADAETALTMLDVDWPPLTPSAPPDDPDRVPSQDVVEETLPAITADILGSGRADGLSWSADGRHIAVAAATGVLVYDAKTTQLLRVLLTDGLARQVIFLRGGEQLLVVAGATAQIWRVRDWSIAHRVGALPPTATIVPAPDGQLVAVVCDEEVTVRRTRDAALLCTPERPGGTWGDVAVFAPDSQVLALASAEGVALYRAVEGAVLRRLQIRLDSPLSLAFAPDGRRLGVMDRGGLRL